ncbi:MAG: UDP-N-acetylenolpyruvoylglucosamine reductase [Bacteroidetes bacterium CG12_big_fil_rev_8_21_14_0_65_60_17]|nr:MAG: UDP-N-acetylenolpyruvoylglucosamine reductase [Bacteroidetes bacterium CG12_big_fil_rev_8_21_14_0_65_60_17]
MLKMVQEELETSLGQGRIRVDASLAPYTTFHIGGPARLLVEPRSTAELVAALRIVQNYGVRHFVLGMGANILVGDRGFDGVVIRNTVRDFRVHPSGRLHAAGGAIVWPDIIRETTRAGWSGLEHFAGIPSTIGGALWQNLHFLSPAPKRERTVFLDEIVVQAELLGGDGTVRTEDHSWFRFGYDYSMLHDTDDIVLEATFQLTAASPDDMQRVIEENLAWRAERHPPLDTEPSAGSIFRKIDGVGAGRLIDECGLKGTRIGGAEITHRHANIMINRGGATARDVRRLIAHVRERVERETGHKLIPEIMFVGEFIEEDSNTGDDV